MLVPIARGQSWKEGSAALHTQVGGTETPVRAAQLPRHLSPARSTGQPRAGERRCCLQVPVARPRTDVSGGAVPVNSVRVLRSYFCAPSYI